MITARMITDKYTEMAPDYPYEVVKYENGRIKLKDIPRIYPASDFKIQKDGIGAALNGKETQRGMVFEQIKLILKCVGISMLVMAAGLAAFLIFAIVYYSCELLFFPWFDDAFYPWLVEQIRIIFSHPENFCGFLFILGAFVGLLVMVGVLIGGGC